MAATVRDRSTPRSVHPDARQAEPRDLCFAELVALRETDLNGRTTDRSQASMRARRSARRSNRSLLFEPVTDRHRANDDLVRTELFLQMRPEVHHQSAPLECRACFGLADYLDVLPSYWIRHSVSFRSENS